MWHLPGSCDPAVGNLRCAPPAIERAEADPIRCLSRTVNPDFHSAEPRFHFGTWSASCVNALQPSTVDGISFTQFRSESWQPSMRRPATRVEWRVSSRPTLSLGKQVCLLAKRADRLVRLGDGDQLHGGALFQPRRLDVGRGSCRADDRWHVVPLIAVFSTTVKLRAELVAVHEQASCGLIVGVRNWLPIPVWGLKVEGYLDQVSDEDALPTVALASVPGRSLADYRIQVAPSLRGKYPVETPNVACSFPLCTLDGSPTAQGSRAVDGVAANVRHARRVRVPRFDRE